MFNKFAWLTIRKYQLGARQTKVSSIELVINLMDNRTDLIGFGIFFIVTCKSITRKERGF